MKKKFDQVYQFKITLKGIRPPIWRRIQVPEKYTFWGLHVAIQDAFGWSDCHLHEFELQDKSTSLRVDIGIPDEDFDRSILAGWNQKIVDYFSMENCSAHYVYDFGDYWVHKIQLEKIIPKEKDGIYPRCIKGKRACPPEDCGGIGGYERLLDIMNNENHEEYDEMIEWLGGRFDPEHFDVDEVGFNDPDKRRNIAFE
ncbi:MAG: plasmid pRiA4b ORF-3 family protein [Candidatus Thermoplasmatota archaeon]|nr:plasmid pRiA4b ORF-3 family protein [Candidatus Thermoplasmatota archaeon]